MTEQQSEVTPETVAPATPQPESGKQPPWGDKPENFDPDKAWELIQKLRAEKSTPDPQLRSELTSLQQQQENQRQALAKALGLAPEETSETDKLAEQVTRLQQEFASSQRKADVLMAAQNNGIPPEFQGWLTADTAEALNEQAKQLQPMVQATLATRGQAPLVTPGAPTGPAFQPIPGQGQGGAGVVAGQGRLYSDYYDEHGRPRS